MITVEAAADHLREEVFDREEDETQEEKLPEVREELREAAWRATLAGWVPDADWHYVHSESFRLDTHGDGRTEFYNQDGFAMTAAMSALEQDYFESVFLPRLERGEEAVWLDHDVAWVYTLVDREHGVVEGHVWSRAPEAKEPPRDQGDDEEPPGVLFADGAPSPGERLVSVEPVLDAHQAQRADTEWTLDLDRCFGLPLRADSTTPVVAPEVRGSASGEDSFARSVPAREAVPPEPPRSGQPEFPEVRGTLRAEPLGPSAEHATFRRGPAPRGPREKELAARRNERKDRWTVETPAARTKSRQTWEQRVEPPGGDASERKPEARSGAQEEHADGSRHQRPPEQVDRSAETGRVVRDRESPASDHVPPPRLSVERAEGSGTAIQESEVHYRRLDPLLAGPGRVETRQREHPEGTFAFLSGRSIPLRRAESASSPPTDLERWAAPDHDGRDRKNTNVAPEYDEARVPGAHRSEEAATRETGPAADPGAETDVHADAVEDATSVPGRVPERREEKTSPRATPAPPLVLPQRESRPTSIKESGEKPRRETVAAPPEEPPTVDRERARAVAPPPERPERPPSFPQVLPISGHGGRTPVRRARKLLPRGPRARPRLLTLGNP